MNIFSRVKASAIFVFSNNFSNWKVFHAHEVKHFTVISVIKKEQVMDSISPITIKKKWYGGVGVQSLLYSPVF